MKHCSAVFQFTQRVGLAQEFLQALLSYSCQTNISHVNQTVLVWPYLDSYLIYQHR